MSGVAAIEPLEAVAAAQAMIEDVTRLVEDLKTRQERLGELLAPSEAALTARTEYLDRVTRQQLGAAGQQIATLSEEVRRLVRNLNESVVQFQTRARQADEERWHARERRDRWQTIAALLSMLLGGFLAGQVASWRSGTTANAKPPALEEKSTAAPNAPATPRRRVGQGTKSTTVPAR